MPRINMPRTPMTGTSARTHHARVASLMRSLGRRLMRSLVLGLPLAVLVPAGVGAQAHPASTPVLSVDFLRPVAPWDAERAAHPADCAASIRRFRDSSMVGKGVDTLLNTDADTLPTFVVQMARQCLRKFPIAALKKSDLADMMSIVQLAEPPDADFDSLLARHMALMPPKSLHERAQLFFEVAYMASNLRPRRIPLTRHFLAMLEALDDSVLVDKMHARGYVERLLYPNNVDTLLKYQHEQYAIAQRLDPAKMTWWPLKLAELNVKVYLRDFGNDSWLRYLKTGADTDLARFFDPVKKDTIPNLLGGLASSSGGGLPGGSALPPLTSEFWFSLDPKAPPMTQPPVFPVPGSLSLLVVIDSKIDKVTAKRFHRFHEKYPQIPMIFLTVTKGFYRNRPLPMTAQQEAEAVRDYFTNFLHLPGYLGVSTTTFLKVSDGRLYPRYTQTELDLETIRINPLTIFESTILINHQGRIIPGGMDVFGLDRLVEIAEQAKKP